MTFKYGPKIVGNFLLLPKSSLCYFKTKKKCLWPLSSRGGGVKALGAGQLKKDRFIFCGFPYVLLLFPFPRTRRTFYYNVLQCKSTCTQNINNSFDNFP